MTGAFTVLAPTNDAFALLPNSVLTNVNLVGTVLDYHILPIRLSSQNLASLLRSWSTKLGPAVTVVAGPAGSLRVDFATVNVTMRDIQCTDGVVHVIDRVLLPPSNPTIQQKAVADADLSTLGMVVSIIRICLRPFIHKLVWLLFSCSLAAVGV